MEGLGPTRISEYNVSKVAMACGMERGGPAYGKNTLKDVTDHVLIMFGVTH